MEDKHYELIKEKVKIFIGKIDGDDINEILRLVNDLSSQVTTKKYFELTDDLDKMVNAMWCEYGLDYGKTKKWDTTVLKILIAFENGYTKSELDLSKLIHIINVDIKD